MTEARDEADALRRFEDSLGLVEAIARQVKKAVGNAVELAELISFGREGLLEAARRFDASRGVPFRAYASYRVRGAIFDGLRKLSRLSRRTHERINGLAAAASVGEGALEDVVTTASATTAAQADAALADHLAALATAMAVGLVSPTARGDEGDPIPLEQADDPEAAVGRAELLQLVNDAISELPREEGELVRRHYLGGERFDHVAAELGLSKSWASRLHTRAMGRLAKRLRNAT